MAVGAGLGRCDPLTLPVAQGTGAIERGRQLHAHPGAGAQHAAEKAQIELARRLRAGADLHLHPRGPEPSQALAGHARVGVDQAGHDARHAGLDQGLAAGAGAALVGTRLERHIGAGPPHRMATGGGIAKRHHLGMGAAGGLGMPLSDDLALGADQHTADRWVGRGQQPGPGGQLERSFNHGVRAAVHRSAV